MPVTIYHNPACGTSRNALAIIRAAGEDLRIVPYLDEPPSRADLARLVSDAGLAPREALRVKGNEARLAALGLAEALAEGDADALLDAMAAHPALINRPFVVTERGTVLARPSERVASVLADPPAAFVKEDGERVDLTAWREPAAGGVAR